MTEPSKDFQLSTIEGIVSFALHEKCKGGVILAAVVGKPLEEGGLFANAVPTSATEARAVAAEIHGAISLDWVASGKKNSRAYQVTIKDGTRETYTERRYTFSPEETRAEDALGAAMHAGTTALQVAAGLMKGPYDRQEAYIERLESRLDAQETAHKEETATLRARVRELENDRSGAVDKLLGYLKTEGESHVHNAQAEAVTIEAQAKAKAWSDISQGAIANLPRILHVGAMIAGASLNKPPPGLVRAAAGLAGVVGAMRAPPDAGAAPSAPEAVKPLPAATLSAEGVAALRAFGASLTPDELGRLVQFACENDREAVITSRIAKLLDESHREPLFSLMHHLPPEWMT